MCGKIRTVLLIFVVLNCSMARYNGRLHCIVGVLPTCYKRKAATYFYPPGGTGPPSFRKKKDHDNFSTFHNELQNKTYILNSIIKKIFFLSVLRGHRLFTISLWKRN